MYIYHHLGLGDHIICHGIVRNICRKFSNEMNILFVKPQFLESVSFMYNDIANIQYMTMNDNQVHEFLKGVNKESIVYIGHQHLEEYIKESKTFDKAFYDQVGLNFKKRWTHFIIRRDLQREIALFNKINPPEKYIFLHDDPKRGLVIDRSHFINKDLPVIIPDITLTNNIFDYLTLMDKAEEIHCIDSSFKLMADSVLNRNHNLFYHLRLLNGGFKDYTTCSMCKLKWKTIW